MKDKILPFIICILIGAIITTVGFFVYEKMNTNNGMYNGGRPEEVMNRGNGENIPDKPDGEQGTPTNWQKENQNTTNGTSNNT